MSAESISDSGGNAEQRLEEMFRKEVDERTRAMLGALESIEQGNPPDPETLASLHRQAHTLKGTAGVMGRQDIYELCQAIEPSLREAEATGTLDPTTATTLIQATQKLISVIQGR